STKPSCVKVSSEWDGHGEAPLFATLNQSAVGPGIPNESRSRRLGISRISAGYLFVIARALATDPAWFFEGILGQDEAQELTSRERMHLELMRNFAAIKDEKQQEAISSMARSLAGS
ncbi:hypothetical protein SAMN02927895_05504, partial [Belnapia rosea]